MAYDSLPAPDPVIMPSGGPGLGPDIRGQAGKYRVIRLLGRGNMASVYLAEQVSMARPVALKILSPNLSNDEQFLDRFAREARASARLNHPNIVSAIDFGEFESRFFLAVEFVDGLTLCEMLRKNRFLGEARVIGIGSQVIAALRHAHEHNVIHLDIKPANIMVRKDGRVKLADFGLAVIQDSPASAEASRKAMGTPYYMAPEQVEGGRLDWRSDQFALGASLYEAVTGSKPFQGSNVSDILMKRFFEKPLPAWQIGRKRASRGFSAVLAKMLSRSPDGRYQSFADLEGDFARVKAGAAPTFARPVTSPVQPAADVQSWDTMGRARIAARIDGLLQRRRWKWLPAASVLFLSLLAGYAALYSTRLLGPRPPETADAALIAEAASLPDDIRMLLRPAWQAAFTLRARADADPTPENLRRVVYSYRLIATNQSYRNTAYAAVAMRRLIGMEKALFDMGEYVPPPWSVSGYEVDAQ